MRHTFRYFIFCVVACGACVDDYTDSNPPRQLDAPFLRVSGSGNNQSIVAEPVNAYQNDYISYAQYGAPVEYIVSVVDAPGLVGQVSVVQSVPDFGTVTLDESSVNALKGKDKGEFRFTFTPSSALPDNTDRSMNLAITVSDSQTDRAGDPQSKTTTFTLPTVLVACVSETVSSGTYVVTEASGNIDGGDTYTLNDLKSEGGVDELTVELSAERPGLLTMDDATGGVWPVFYSGRAPAEVGVDNCGNDLAGHPGATTAGGGDAPLRDFTIEGTLQPDGSIMVNWSYERLDAATPDTPASGSYRIVKQ